MDERETGISPLVPGAGIDVQKMKEEDTVDESEPAASLTLSKVDSTAMNKLVKAMAP